MPGYTPPDIPIPSPPGLPSGLTNNDTTYYNLTGGYSNGSVLVGSDLERLITLVDNLTATGLAAIGYGTLIGGVAGTPTGFNLPISAWRGILPATTDRIGYAAGVAQAATRTIPGSSTFVVWAVPVSGTYADSTTYDTAESGIADFEVITDGSTVDGGLPLCSGVTNGTGVTGSITDLRVAIGTTEMQAALTALQTLEASDVADIYNKLGAGYLPAASPASAPVDDRLNALEAGAVDSLTILWDGLERTADDPTTISEYVVAQIGPPIPVAPPSQISDDVVVSNTIKTLAGLTTLANSDTYALAALDVLLIIPGITSDSLIDFTATTAAVDEIAHTFS